MMQRRECRKFRFTKKLIDGLPVHPKEAKSREQEYSDEQVTGLRVLVSKNGRKFFHMRYTYNKRKRVVSIGEFPAVTVQEARDRSNEYRNMLSKGIDPLTEREKLGTDVTFAEFSEREYVPHSKANKKSWKDDVWKLERDMLPAFGSLPLLAINTRDIQKYLTNIKTRTSPSTANRHYALLNRMFNLAIQWQFLEKNPCQGVQKNKESGGKERFLSEDELGRFLRALDQVNQGPSAYLIRLLLFTGVRMSEGLQLLWKNVDLESGTALLPNTKSGKARTVVLNELAREVVVAMEEQRENEYVFPGKGPKGHLTTPRKAFEAVKELAGIENLRIHDLRHNFASLGVNSGCSLYSIQRLLGHHSSDQTQKYAHLSDQAVKDATDGVADRIKKSMARSAN